MAGEVFKCPNCYGTNYKEEKGITLCKSCGSKFQSLRFNFGSKESSQLYFEAVNKRTTLHFDEAGEILDELISKNPEISEYYYQRLLCKLGVSFVDEDNSRKITISRLSNLKITDMDDYKKAIDKASSEEIKEEYKQAFAEIEKIRQKAIEVSSKIKNYSVFISFKQHPDNDRNAFTADYDIARQIYEHLIGRGYEVFFSPVSLQEKSGADYEPIIYHALRTAKIMLVVAATQGKDYVESVWVKNEWSRYLQFIKEEEDRILIPVLANGYQPENLPSGLARKQCLNFDANFWTNLDKRVDESAFIEVETMLKRSGSSKVTIKKKEVTTTEVTKRTFKGGSTVIEASAQTIIKIANSNLKAKAFEQAEGAISNYIENNPTYKKNGTLNWLLFLSAAGVSDGDALKSSSKTIADSKTALQYLYYALNGDNLSQDDYEYRANSVIEYGTSLLSEGHYGAFNTLYTFISKSLPIDKRGDEIAYRYVEVMGKNMHNGRHCSQKVLEVLDNILDAASKGGTDFVIALYNHIGENLVYSEEYELAGQCSERVLKNYFEADCDALTISLFVKYQVNDFTSLFMVKDPNVAEDVKNVLTKINAGGYVFDADSDSNVFKLMLEGAAEVLERNDPQAAYDFLNIVYSSIPITKDSQAFCRERLEFFARAFLIYGEYDAAKEICTNYISENDKPSYNIAVIELCANNKCNSIYELMYSDVKISDPKSENGKAYYQVLEIAGNTRGISEDAIIEYGRIHDKIATNEAVKVESDMVKGLLRQYRVDFGNDFGVINNMVKADSPLDALKNVVYTIYKEQRYIAFFPKNNTSSIHKSKASQETTADEYRDNYSSSKATKWESNHKALDALIYGGFATLAVFLVILFSVVWSKYGDAWFQKSVLNGWEPYIAWVYWIFFIIGLVVISVASYFANLGVMRLGDIIGEKQGTKKCVLNRSPKDGKNCKFLCKGYCLKMEAMCPNRFGETTHFKDYVAKYKNISIICALLMAFLFIRLRVNHDLWWVTYGIAALAEFIIILSSNRKSAKVTPFAAIFAPGFIFGVFLLIGNFWLK